MRTVIIVLLFLLAGCAEKNPISDNTQPADIVNNYYQEAGLDSALFGIWREHSGATLVEFKQDSTYEIIIDYGSNTELKETGTWSTMHYEICFIIGVRYRTVTFNQDTKIIYKTDYCIYNPGLSITDTVNYLYMFDADFIKE